MNNKRYFSRSWALLTRDKGWIKPLLVMAAANLVPIVGYFGTLGYAQEWARLSAWGVDAAPKQKNVDVGKCIISGARGFVIALGWGLVSGVVMGVPSVLAALVPDTLGVVLSGLISFAVFIITAFYNVAIKVAQVRASIYEKVGAGYRPDRILDMIRGDSRGFVELCVTSLIISFAMGIVVFVVSMIAMVALVPFIVVAAEGSASTSHALAMLGTTLMIMLPLCVIVGYAFMLVSTAVETLLINAVGLWMRQFNVPAWGRSEDPLPPLGM